MRAIALAAVLSAFALPVYAQTTPTDCSRATTPVVEAICADVELRDLDRAVREAYVKALGRIDRDSIQALQKDQKAFLDERQMVIDRKTQSLSDYMRNRIAFLENVQSPAWGRDANAFVGTWRNSLGEVRVTRDADGQLVVGISTLSPAIDAWICDIESQTEGPKNGRVSFTEDEVKVTLSRRGSALVVGDQLPQGDGGRTFCSSNGYIDGAYFKVK